MKYSVYTTWTGHSVYKSILIGHGYHGPIYHAKHIATFDDAATADAICKELNESVK